MNDTQGYTKYRVEKTRDSASAIIIFARHPYTNEQIVLKVLREMKDERYDLSTIEKRQKCQMEALSWNPRFTSDVYSGLAHIRESLEELERKKLILEEIGVGYLVDNPEKLDRLLKNHEYVLLMRFLPEDRRLDELLKANFRYKRGETIPLYLLLLLKRISSIHAVFPTIIPASEANWWGSLEQLREKLNENLAWLKKALIHKSDLSDTYNLLKENFLPVLETKKYQDYFTKRKLEGNHIKRCHGDLKADNIWIEPGSPQCEEQPETCIRLLDCIDFKSSFCMIDTLSDIALLIVDIQARTGNADLANAIIDEYLHISGEEEETAKYLLTYYLVEKAIIGTVNSYIDDENEELGDGYHKAALQRLNELMSRMKG